MLGQFPLHNFLCLWFVVGPATAKQAGRQAGRQASKQARKQGSKPATKQAAKLVSVSPFPRLAPSSSEFSEALAELRAGMETHGAEAGLGCLVGFRALVIDFGLLVGWLVGWLFDCVFCFVVCLFLCLLVCLFVCFCLFVGGWGGSDHNLPLTRSKA